MSSVDIEDVLSSIRRLVSEDLRPLDTPAERTRTAIVDPSNRLLLTPALRVVTKQVSSAGAADAAATPTPADTVNQNMPSPDLPSMIADVVAENSGFTEENARDPAVADEDWLPESSEDEAYPDSEKAASSVQNKTATPDKTATQDKDLTPDKTATQSKAGAEAKVVPESALTRVVSEIGAGVSEAADDWESETGDAPVSTVSWQAPEWVEEAELVGDAGVGKASDDAIDESDDGDDMAARKAAADLAEDAAIEEIMARAKAGAADKAKTAAKAEPAKEEPANPSVKPDAKPEAAQPGQAAEDDIFAEDEGVFDETVLRDLVRDLIREELSGTLGERITRNVRKLVRAEINRALTARDFD